MREKEEIEQGGRSCTPACDPKTLAMRSSVKRNCRILLEKSASTDFFLPGIECKMNNTNTSTTRWSVDSDTCSIAWRRRGGRKRRRRRKGGRKRRGSKSATQSLAVIPHLDPALGYSLLEADRGADSVKYHKLVRHPVEQDIHSITSLPPSSPSLPPSLPPCLPACLPACLPPSLPPSLPLSLPPSSLTCWLVAGFLWEWRRQEEEG